MGYLSINDMKLLAKLRNVDGYESTSRQQLKNTFSIPSSPKPFPGPKKPTLNHLPLPQNLKSLHPRMKLKKMK